MRIKKIIKLCIPEFLEKKIRRFILISSLKRQKIEPCENGRIFIFHIPTHANIGDHAIAVAEITYLKNKFPNLNIYLVNDMDRESALSYLKPLITKRDIIIFRGSGSMGTIWPNDEYDRVEVINTFPQNKIIIFPQTVYYEKTGKGKEILSSSRQAFINHKSLHIIARDLFSYEILKECFPECNLYATPDFVLSLDRQEPWLKREGILLCLRNDKEQSLTGELTENIKKISKKKTDNVNVFDTVINCFPILSDKKREKYINKTINKFKHSRLVITDRMHGMIFSAITATPCIALDNNYHKIKAQYDWIKDLKYIKYARQADDIEDLIDELWEMKNIIFDNKELIKKYAVVCNIIESEEK